MNIDLGKVESTGLIKMLSIKKKPVQKEAVYVKCKGKNKPKKVVIDEDKNKRFTRLLKQMTDKNNCYDLF